MSVSCVCVCVSPTSSTQKGSVFRLAHVLCMSGRVEKPAFDAKCRKHLASGRPAPPRQRGVNYLIYALGSRAPTLPPPPHMVSPLPNTYGVVLGRPPLPPAMMLSMMSKMI